MTLRVIKAILLLGVVVFNSGSLFCQEKAEMVLIPAGEFLMGKDRSADKPTVEKSYIDNYAHKVWIDAFYMDKYEVTNAQYYQFCLATRTPLPELWGMGAFHCGLAFPDNPVVGVTYGDAKEYARWLGKRLPTEAEWEYAARGGLVGKNYPYGDELDNKQANFAPASKGTRIVGSYPANGYGLFDMVGNVTEWVADYYDKDYYKTGPDKNPGGPEIGKQRVIRGGGWHTGISCSRVYYRNSLGSGWVDFNVGFRCAKNK